MRRVLTVSLAVGAYTVALGGAATDPAPAPAEPLWRQVEIVRTAHGWPGC